MGIKSALPNNRRLEGVDQIAHEQLNVTRDVMDFEFLLNSDVSEEQIKYDLYIKEWKPTHMIL